MKTWPASVVPCNSIHNHLATQHTWRAPHISGSQLPVTVERNASWLQPRKDASEKTSQNRTFHWSTMIELQSPPGSVTCRTNYQHLRLKQKRFRQMNFDLKALLSSSLSLELYEWINDCIWLNMNTIVKLLSTEAWLACSMWSTVVGNVPRNISRFHHTNMLQLSASDVCRKVRLAQSSGRADREQMLATVERYFRYSKPNSYNTIETHWSTKLIDTCSTIATWFGELLKRSSNGYAGEKEKSTSEHRRHLTKRRKGYESERYSISSVRFNNIDTRMLLATQDVTVCHLMSQVCHLG